MTKLYAARERGFTLIEMSIVLIIIGLIIGGILKGQELIESARQKNFISQTDSIKAATNSFVDRFRALPGDANTNPCATTCVAGNADGVLNAPAANVAAIALIVGNNNEPYQYFNMLSGAGFIGGASSALQATGSANFANNGTNASPLPGSAFPQSGLTIAYGTHQGTATNTDNRLTHWLRLSKYLAAGTLTAANTVIAPVRALQLDVKFDDGGPDSGVIRSSSIISTQLTAGDCGTAGTTGGTYSATETQLGCHILVALD